MSASEIEEAVAAADAELWVNGVEGVAAAGAVPE